MSVEYRVYSSYLTEDVPQKRYNLNVKRLAIEQLIIFFPAGILGLVPFWITINDLPLLPSQNEEYFYGEDTTLNFKFNPAFNIQPNANITMNIDPQSYTNIKIYYTITFKLEM